MTTPIDRTKPEPQQIEFPQEDDKKRDLSHLVPGGFEESSSKRQRVYKKEDDFFQDVFNNDAPFDSIPRKLVIQRLETHELLTDDNRTAVDGHPDPDSLICILMDLSEGLLDQESLNAVLGHAHTGLLAQILSTLKVAGILIEEFLYDVISFKNPAALLPVLLGMHEARILTEDTFRIIVNRTDQELTLLILGRMQVAGLFTKPNFTTAIHHKQPWLLHRVLEILFEEKLLTPETFEHITKTQELPDLKWAILKFKKKNLLNLENLLKLLTFSQSGNIYKALRKLQANTLLTKIYFEFIITQAEPEHHAGLLVQRQRTGDRIAEKYWEFARSHGYSIIVAIKELQDADILTPQNEEYITSTSYPKSLAKIFVILQRAGLLTPLNKAVLLGMDKTIPLLLGAVMELSEANLLDQKMFDLLASHGNKKAFRAIRLMDAGTMTRSNVKAIIYHKDPESLAEAFDILFHNALLTKENIKSVIAHEKPKKLADAFQFLKRRGILNPIHSALVTTNSRPHILATLLVRLDVAEILTEETRDLTAKFTDSQTYDYNNFLMIEILESGGLLTEESYLDTIKHPDPLHFALFIFDYFLETRDLTDEAYQLAVNHPSAFHLAFIFVELSNHAILTEECSLIVIHHPDTIGLFQAIRFMLLMYGEVTLECWNLISTHASPHNFVQVLDYLKKANLFTDENIALVSGHTNLSLLVEALEWMEGRIAFDEVHQLTAERLHLLVKRSDPLEVAKDLVP